MKTFEEYLAAQEWNPQVTQPNQLRRDLMGVNGLNPWDGANSSSRKQMFSSHIGQCLVLIGATNRYIHTGVEREYGKYTFSIKMPHDGRVVRVVDRYTAGIDRDSIALNPQRVVIYERSDNKEIGVVDIHNYCSHHQYFGFRYRPGPAAAKAIRGAEIPRGEIFMDSTSVQEDGSYHFGIQARMALMAHPACSEDGIVIDRTFLPSLRFRQYETRVIDYGSKRFARNLYGDDQHFKPWPDIGDYVREDGLLVALAEYNPILAATDMSVKGLQKVDYYFDKLTYAGAGKGRVVDVRVRHEQGSYASMLPEGMTDQVKKYDRARRAFYTTLINEYNSLRKIRGAALQISPEFHRLLVEAISVVGHNTLAPKDPIRKLYRQAPLDEIRVEITIEYEIEPNIGFKLTGLHGNRLREKTILYHYTMY